jgi:hypothetical protein
LTIDSSGNVTVGNGNLIMGTSGNGIDFSATSGTGTSELFDDYEEGVYSPTVTPQTSGSFTLVSSNDTAAYTKIGRQVTASGQIRIDTPTSPVGTYVDISLPFTVASLADAASYGGAYIEIGSTQTMTVTQPGLAVFRCFIDASTISGGTYIAYTITFPAA